MAHRLICDVLEEMRIADKTKNYSYMNGLIEETQTMANRMEDALYNHKDYNQLHDQVKELKKIKTKLIKSIKDKGGKVSDELDSKYL